MKPRRMRSYEMVTTAELVKEGVAYQSVWRYAPTDEAAKAFGTVNNCESVKLIRGGKVVASWESKNE